VAGNGPAPRLYGRESPTRHLPSAFLASARPYGGGARPGSHRRTSWAHPSQALLELSDSLIAAYERYARADAA